MRPFCNANVSWHGTNVEAHTSHIMLHMLNLTKKPYSSRNRETVHIDICYSPSHYLPFEPLLPWDLAYMHYNVRRGVGAQVMRVAGYANFSLNKFESLSITLWYNALPLIIFDHAFHISSTEPNPCTNLSQPQCALSIATFIGKFLEHRESLLTFTHITWNVIFFVS